MSPQQELVELVSMIRRPADEDVSSRIAGEFTRSRSFIRDHGNTLAELVELASDIEHFSDGCAIDTHIGRALRDFIVDLRPILARLTESTP